ncbi:phage portal protein [Rossellomorea marisflavi]|uniref:Portal protein n=1 Tax=Rossellomorea marisflavi TaxID=189381 RepID=A0A163MUE4_9BACI|nr:phage portal protein [Rossellomorea marisflavi]KZE53403.1 portal protein [Rossellomorea marisflavi]
MKALDWFSSWFRDKSTITLNAGFMELVAKVHYKRLAIDTCTDIIANALTRCEFTTFKKGKETRGNLYYMLNVAPNQNQNATEFFHSIVTHLINDNECLVLQQGEELIIADSFDRTVYATKPNSYKNVQVGDFKFDKTFPEKDVFYFKLNDHNIMKVIDSLYEDYGKLLASGINYYKRKNNKRYAMKGDYLRGMTEEEQNQIDEMFEEQLKDWFDPNKEGAAFHLSKDLDMEDMSDGQKSTGNVGTSRDIRDLVNDVIDFVAMGLHVPRGIIKGDVSDIEKQIDSFLMFCILPLVKLIQTELNRKFYEKEQFLERSYIKVDTSQIKVVDIVQLANAVDKLFAVGGLCIDDILELLGKEPLNTKWSKKRFVTKNYQDAENLEGGEKNENEPI